VTVADYPDWQTPQAHATQIATTGVPLLRFTNNLGFSASATIVGGATVTLLPSIAINQPGYEVAVTVSMPAGTGTLPFIRLSLQWLDATSNIQVARRDVVMAAGNAAGNALTYYIRGPMHGNRFIIRAVNIDPAVTATIAWTANETSHVFEHDEAIQNAYAGTAPNGYTNPAGVATANLIAYTAASLAASAANIFLCALYAGDVILNIDSISAANATKVELFDPSGYITGAALSPIFGVTVAAAGSASLQLTLPFSPLLLKVTNLGTAGAISPVVALEGQLH
jgi:hypothetical protein